MVDFLSPLGKRLILVYDLSLNAYTVSILMFFALLLRSQFSVDRGYWIAQAILALLVLPSLFIFRLYRKKSDSYYSILRETEKRALEKTMKGKLCP